MEITHAATPMIIIGFSLGVLFAICVASNNMICGFMFVNWTQIENKYLTYTTIWKPSQATIRMIKKYKVIVLLGIHFNSSKKQKKS
jgi:hypothetical protein